MEIKPTTIKVIIGLGNPGASYVFNRHNIGFRIVDMLVDHCGGTWKKKSNAEVSEVTINDHLVVIIKPQTFMNSSGQVIPDLFKKGIKAEQILVVVHDELEKPFGYVGFKQAGSHKGHNGLKSIIGICGADFWRLRCGIGRPENKEDVPNYVLSNFRESKDAVDTMIKAACFLITQSIN